MGAKCCGSKEGPHELLDVPRQDMLIESSEVEVIRVKNAKFQTTADARRQGD